MAIQGAPLSLLDLAIGLRDEGVVDPVFVGSEPGPLVDRVHDKHIRLLMNSMSRAARLTAKHLHVHIQRTATLLNAETISLVYANTLHSFPAIIAADTCGIPCVWMIRESDPWWAAFDDYGAEVRSLAMEACVRATRVVFVADATRGLWRDRISLERVATIPTQLRVDPALSAPSKTDARDRLGVSHDELMILSVGELSSLKGQADVIAAFAQLPSDCIKLSRLIFVGNGKPEERRRIEAKLATLPKERRERVRIDPASLDASAYFAAADIYVLASHSESYPRVILEAMAYRLAILATAVYGVKEQIHDGVDGYLAGVGDIDALVAGLTRLLRDPYDRQRLGIAARRTHDARAGFGSVITAHARLIKEIAIARPAE
jgi:glycosyltransferase involved in cell wall biosynthesis